MNNIKDLIFTDDSSDNWLFKEYYFSGANSRYWTFQIALNLLNQRVEKPVIAETGCQRMKDDLGAGMSSSIFGKYCSKYNGLLHVVDLIEVHLNTCKSCTAEFKNHIQYHVSDSIAWLRDFNSGPLDLLYLDSYDHPYGELLDLYGGRTDIQKAIKQIDSFSQEEILKKHASLITPCQIHCLNEFKAAEQSGKVTNKTIILIDDNQLPGGGKSRLAKDYLHKNKWICLMDLQQSLWVKEL